MEKEFNRFFYIDAFSGIIKECYLKEKDKDGIWIKCKGESINTFVFADMVDKRVLKKKENADAELDKIRKEMKEKLVDNKAYIDDICERLEKHEGRLYVDIIKEILQGD